jgi:WD40 repeat protein
MNQAIPDVSVSPTGDSVAVGRSRTADQPSPSGGANGSGAGKGVTVDRFTIIRQIGQGGMGNVFLARHPVTDTEVALKCLKPELAGNAKAVKRFLAEARHMYHLNHPHVLRIMEVGEGPRGPYYVMPYMPAGALASSLTRGTPADAARTLAIAREVADALAYAHSRGILHRDLKPANVLLDDAGHACLGDFGMVHDFTTNDSVADPRVSYCEGTVAYMSPAVARGEAEDTRCDIYAFGAMLCELLTGEVPYAAPTVKLTLDLIAEGTPVNILQRNPAAPRGLARIAEGCMARELRDRYARMSDVAADLERVSKGQRPLGPHGTWGRTPPRWAARAALVVVAMLIAAGVFVAVRPRLVFGPRPPVAPAFIARTIDLTDLIEPSLDATPDAAVRTTDGIRLTRGSIASDRTFLVFPYEPPDEYDLIIEFERTSGTDGLDHCIVHRDRAFIWTLGGLGNNVSCFWRIGNATPFQDGAPTMRRRSSWVTNGEVHKSEVRVRNTSASAYLDGQLASSYTTTTGYQEARLPTDSDEYPDAWGRRLGLSILRSDFIVRSVKVVERSGPGTVHAHHGSDRNLVWAKRVGKPRPYSVRFVNDGGVLACTSSPHQDRRLCSVWNRDGNQLAAPFDVCWAVASADGRRLARALDGGGFNLADINDANRRDVGTTSQGVPAAFSPDGGRIVHVPDLSTVHVVSASDGAKVVDDWKVPNAAWVGFAPDSEHVVAIGRQSGTGIVTLRSVKEKDEGWTTDLPGVGEAASTASAEFSPDGKWLLVRCGGSVVCLSTEANNKNNTNKRLPAERIEFPHATDVVSAHFSADSRYIVVATARPDSPTSTALAADGLQLWELSAPSAPIQRLTQKDARIGAMELSPDGHWLAVGDYRGDIRLIDFNTGQLLATLTGHDGPVISLAISPDGKNIASGSEDGVVRLFKVPDAVPAGGK